MIVEIVNSWGTVWFNFMFDALIDGTLLLAAVALAWLVLRRRASAQLGYLLFLLVSARMAVPLAVPVPASIGWLSPREAGARIWQRFGADSHISRPERTTVRADSINDLDTQVDFTAHADLLPYQSTTAVASSSRPQRLSVKTWLMLGWSSIVASLLARFSWIQWSTSQRFRNARLTDPAAIAIDMTSLGRRVGLRRTVPIATTPLVDSPVIWGLWRPRLIMPPGLADRLPHAQLEWVLLHELAHVRRYDLWIALFQRLVQIVYFFHPAVWLANWQIDRQREFACDDAALAATNAKSRDCAAALISVAEWASGASPRPAMALIHSASLLRRRVLRLVDNRRGRPSPLSLPSIAFLCVVATVVLPRVRAEGESDASKKTKKEKPSIQASFKSARSDEVSASDSQANAVNAHDPETSAQPTLDERSAALKAIRKAGARYGTGSVEWYIPGMRDADPKSRILRVSLDVEPNRAVPYTDDLAKTLAALPEVEWLRLSRSGITDDQLSSLPLGNLKHLDLRDTAITDKGLERLRSLQSLEQLFLARTAVTSRGMNAVGQLPNLLELDLSETAVDDSGAAQISSLPKLTRLRMNKTPVTDVGLEQLGELTHLQQLELRETNVTDRGMRYLQGRSKLTWLDLSGTQIGDAAVHTIEGLTNMAVIELTDTRVSDDSLAVIGRWKDLWRLGLGRTAVTDEGVKQLRNLSKLLELDLHGTRVTDAALRSLVGIELTKLNLADTAISNAAFEYLQRIVSLKQLNLSSTQITDPRLDALKLLPRLTSVDVRGTSVTALDLFRAIPQTNTNVQKLLAALAEQTELNVLQTALTDVIDYFEQRHDIEIELDARSLTDAGISTDTLITAQAHGTLREALESVIKPLKLKMAIRHEVLWIAAEPLPEHVSDFPVVPAGQRLSPRIAAAVMEPTDFVFVEEEFSRVVDFFAKKHGIEIEIDAKSLANAGITLDCPVTKRIRGITLKSALELELDDLELTCVAEGEKLIIRNRHDLEQ
jgi:beta-lactamase regulating signal transducer with metallopeptidase domain/Leucine-rich repeat (LRR) protein